ncbi:hypothetical protein OsI_05405 [Oryza sativa Indica Group]|uniref:AP-3 complex subunit beta n=1 Tax=Oryza sativa subsp. indica TaxID=39946 RepID=A2WZL8_ORYSI|nr:hypothetical protein OsI_05405 [Oryza sativa Indica Group]
MFGLQASGAAASWVVGRMGTDAHLYDDPDDASIPTLLDSRFDADKLDALKRLLALIAQGVDVAHFFPQVVKNVASQSLEVKKLVYLYLLHYAEKRQNEALLSINIFQKDLSDINPLVRAWALRTMAGIRLHVVAPLVLVAVKKCARDPSAYVRKCAAYALCKLHDLLPDETTSLEDTVDVLFSDNSPGVVGATAVAFNSVCPNCLPLISKHFQRLCETLPDIEEWAQILLIDIILRYVIARHGLVKDSSIFASNLTLKSQGSGDSALIGNETCGTTSTITLFRHYIEEYSECLEGDIINCSSVTSSTNNDVALLLKCTSPLLWSRNSGVILAAASVHWIMAPVDQLNRVVGPILFTLRSSPDATYVMLGNILVFAKTAPQLFAPFYEDFFICTSDPYQTKALKLEILTTIATESSIPAIFEEFQDYIKEPDRRFVADTVAAIALCAQKLPSITTSCLGGLLALVFYESSISDSANFDGEAAVLVQAILSIKAIVRTDPASHEKVIVRLVRSLDKIKEPAARSLIIWIFGEYSSIGNIIPKITPAVLKYLAWSFAAEMLETKLQILNAAAKVIIHSPEEHLEEFKKIMAHVIKLATCDLSYDVRDRARFISRLLPYSTTYLNGNNSSCQSHNEDMFKELANHIFDGKMPSIFHPTNNYRIYLPGSLSQVVLHAAPGYAPLPKPQSMELIHKTMEPTRGVGNSSESINSDAESGSSTYDSGSVYDSESEVDGSSDRNAADSNTKDNQEDPLVHVYDASVDQDITIKSEEASGSEDGLDQTLQGSASVPTIVLDKEIQLLAPEQTEKMVLQVHFHHHLLPLKLSVLCNGKRHPAKLHPDIAYFVRPLPMDLNAFLCKENQLRGMFEYARRCTFKDHLQKLEHNDDSEEHTDKNLLIAQSLASKILSNANFHLVSMDMPVTFSIEDASGLCWRFSSEILSTSNPCLITILAEGHISEPLDLTAKVNSEDTAFGLNLLNRVVAIIE